MKLLGCLYLERIGKLIKTNLDKRTLKVRFDCNWLHTVESP